MANHKDQVILSVLIESMTGHKVLALTDQVRKELEPLVEQAIAAYNAGPRYTGRPNEFGNYMETVLKATCDRFTKPTKANGKKQSTGYPDLAYQALDGSRVYPEVKTLKQGSNSNPMRSFYISSFDKVTTDAAHVVIGFEHRDNVLTGKYHIIDMSSKTLTVKVEYACSNKDMYC